MCIASAQHIPLEESLKYSVRRVMLLRSGHSKKYRVHKTTTPRQRVQKERVKRNKFERTGPPLEFSKAISQSLRWNQKAYLPRTKGGVTKKRGDRCVAR